MTSTNVKMSGLFGGLLLVPKAEVPTFHGNTEENVSFFCKGIERALSSIKFVPDALKILYLRYYTDGAARDAIELQLREEPGTSLADAVRNLKRLFPVSDPSRIQNLEFDATRRMMSSECLIHVPIFHGKDSEDVRDFCTDVARALSASAYRNDEEKMSLLRCRTDGAAGDAVDLYVREHPSATSAEVLRHVGVLFGHCSSREELLRELCLRRKRPTESVTQYLVSVRLLLCRLGVVRKEEMHVLILKGLPSSLARAMFEFRHLETEQFLGNIIKCERTLSVVQKASKGAGRRMRRGEPVRAYVSAVYDSARTRRVLDDEECNVLCLQGMPRLLSTLMCSWAHLQKDDFVAKAAECQKMVNLMWKASRGVWIDELEDVPELAVERLTPQQVADRRVLSHRKKARTESLTEYFTSVRLLLSKLGVTAGHKTNIVIFMGLPVKLAKVLWGSTHLDTDSFLTEAIWCEKMVFLNEGRSKGAGPYSRALQVVLQAAEEPLGKAPSPTARDESSTASSGGRGH